MPAPSALSLTNVAKTYRGGNQPAVDHLDLEVHAGEIFGFLGPNGAGKTTTIKMIVGLLLPDRGQILVGGRDVVREPVGVKRCLGYVPDNPDLYERLTGMEYLNLLADVFMVPAAERKNIFTELLSVFELTDAAPDLIQSYSHGMKQKLALIGALFHQPDLLILDEPMVGLDPRSAHLFKEIMRRHCDKGGTVFFSTHVLEVAERLCDRVGIIQRGKLIACGTPAELRERVGAEKTLESIFLELTESGVES